MQEMVLRHCDSLDLGAEVAEFSRALGRILAEDVAARDPLPPFPASIKDGYGCAHAAGRGFTQPGNNYIFTSISNAFIFHATYLIYTFLY